MKFTVRPDSDSYIALSGGVDSIAAAIIAKRKFGIDKAYHFNHKLRPQNDVMETKVRKFCEKFGFELIVKRGDKLKSEAECRHARINGFFTIVGGNLITAHHLDDATESYLLNVFRSHENYLPIPIVSDFPTGKILHPFLLFEKKQFQQIVQKEQLTQYVEEDSTNSESKGSRRNWIRNELIPFVETQKIGLKTLVRKKYMVKMSDLKIDKS